MLKLGWHAEFNKMFRKNLLWSTKPQGSLTDVLQKKCSDKFRKIQRKAQSSVWNFVKKETRAQLLSFEFCKILKNTFFVEDLRRLLLQRSTENRPVKLETEWKT